MSSGKLVVRFVEIDTTIADDHYLGEVFNPEIVIVSQEQPEHPHCLLCG